MCLGPGSSVQTVDVLAARIVNEVLFRRTDEMPQLVMPLKC